MKKSICLICILCIVVPSLAFSISLPKEGNTFDNGISFGMSFKEVENLLDGVLITSNGDNSKVFTVDDFIGYSDTTWYFCFSNDRLYLILIYFPTQDKTYKKIKSDYTTVDKNLEKAYGKPDEFLDTTRWKSGKKGKESLESLIRGDFSLHQSWYTYYDTSGATIAHTLYGKGHLPENNPQLPDISHIVSFTNTSTCAITSSVEKYEDKSRPPTDTLLSSGTWECPDHIPAGEYVVTPIKSANIFVYREDRIVTAEYLTTEDNDEIGRLVLQAGDRIEISGGKLQFVPFK